MGEKKMKMQLFLLALGVILAMETNHQAECNVMEGSDKEMDPEMAALMEETNREMEKYEKHQFDEWIAENEREGQNIHGSVLPFRMDGEVQIGIIYKICQFCDGCSLNKLRRCSKILLENMKAKFPKFVNS